MKDLLDLLHNGDYTTLVTLSLIIIFIWLFKDMKKSLLDIKKSDLNFIDQSIESHSQSLKAINLFLNDSISDIDLLNILYSSYKYFDTHILDLINKFTSSSYIISSLDKSILLMDLSKELKRKISQLKDNQLHSTINKNYKLSIFYFFDTASKNNFDIYLNAFLYSVIILTVSSISLELIMKIYLSDSKTSVPLFVLIVGYIFWLFLLPISIDLLLKKCYKKIYLFVLFFLSPFVLTYFMHICQYYIGKILLIILFVVSISISFYVNLKYSELLHKK